MSVAASQGRVFLGLLRALRPHWRDDFGLPGRIQRLLATRREFGARDRRLYRELLYTTLRHLPWVEPWLDRDPPEALRRVAWLAGPAAAGFRETFATGEDPAGDPAELLPEWFRAHAPELFTPEEAAAQARRPPLWIRLQTERPTDVLAEFATHGWSARASAVLAEAYRIDGDPDLTRTAAWRAGAFEVQDLASQLVLALAGVGPGGHWLDACAGAGGKTLQLARLLRSEGRLEATDPRPAALRELRIRAARAGLRNVHVAASLRPAIYDGVLVDAPCSGSGTWRRAPHLKWVTRPEHVERAAARQLRLLGELAPRVRPGGRLVYATCSLSRRENDEVVATFLHTHPDFAPRRLTPPPGGTAGPAGLTLWPARLDSDGFFVAALDRR